jgi:pyruvate,water dikinase
MVRAIFIQLGTNYKKAGLLDSRQDIFWLTTNEVFTIETVDAKQLVKERQKQYAEYEKVIPSNRIVIEDGSASEVKDATRHSELIGTSVSAGTITGEVIIVTDPKSVKNIAGKILVTKTTDPGWVFLLVNAAGIIAEKGSLLSHTAIIARELCIPAIVGVENATKCLKNGDRVIINSESGRVEIVDE